MGLMDKWTNGEREAPEPLEGPITATVVTLTAAWFVLFLAQLPFYGWYADHGHTWFLWTCAAGGGLGLVGIWYVRNREKGLRRAAEAQAAGSGSAAAGTNAGTGTGTSAGEGSRD